MTVVRVRGGGSPAAARRQGLVAIVLATLLWSVGAVVASGLFERGVSPVQLVELRTCVTAIGLVAIACWLAGTRPPTSRGARRSTTGQRLALVGFGVAIAVANASLFLAIQHLPVAVAMVLQSLAPAFVISWLALSGRRRPGIRMLIGTAAALVGVALVVQLPTTAPGRINVVGVLFGLATALGVAAFSVLGERATKSYGAIHGNAIAFTVATIFWVMVQAPRGVPELLRQEQLFGQVAVVGVLGTLAPFVLFAWGTARVGPESGSLGISLEPIFSAVIAWIWLGQALGLLQIVGMICIIGGIVYIQHHAPAAIDQGRRPGGPPLVTRLGLRGCEAASNGMPTRPPRQTAGHHAGTCRRKRLAEGRAADSVMRSASPRSAGGRGRLPWAWCTVCGATGWTRSDRLRRW